MNEVDSSPPQQSNPPHQPQPRMLVPDFARGIALLGIALANLPTAWLVTSANTTSFGAIDTPIDKALAVFSAMFVHVRGLPMFSTLLGFGVGLIALSLWRKRFPVARARAILVRRYGFLALLGVVHLLFIFFGDIMFYYGLCGMILALLLTVSDKVLLTISYIVLTVVALIGVALTVFSVLNAETVAEFTAGTDLGVDVHAMTSYPAILAFNAISFVLVALSFPMMMVPYLPVMIIGFVWARRGVLAQPEKHLKTLVTWSVIATIIIIAIGIPWGLSLIGVLPAEYAAAFELGNASIGVVTGPGILAFITLLLLPIQRRINAGAPAPAWVAPFVALGKRSMTGYVLQSIFFFFICYPLALGFNPDSTLTQQSLLGLAVWAATLAIAWLLEKAGKPGPFEYIHRRLAYGPTRQPELLPANKAVR